MKNRNLLIQHLNKTYTKVPNSIFNRLPRLSSTSIALYVLLLMLPENFQPTIAYITDKLNLSKNTARRHLKYLCERGMIKKTRRGKFKECDIYEFRPIKEWK